MLSADQDFTEPTNPIAERTWYGCYGKEFDSGFTHSDLAKSNCPRFQRSRNQFCQTWVSPKQDFSNHGSRFFQFAVFDKFKGLRFLVFALLSQI